jgi:uncharacterized membrane protein (DUF373 family)
MENEPKKPYFLNVRMLRQVLIGVDDLLHFAVALVLALCGIIFLARTLPNLLHPDVSTLLQVLNDVLLVLIIMELMWPIIRFLKREPFILNPFLYIGIISCVRRILLIEAEHSMVGKAAGHETSWEALWPMLTEMGANVVIILVLAIALRLVGSSPAKIEA